MSNLQSNYTRILDVLHDLEPRDYFLKQIRLPKLTDKELIALSLAAESLGIDSERYLFKRLPTVLVGKIDRSVYNRRKRNLNTTIELIRRRIVSHLGTSDTYHIIDSMPLEVCKFARSSRAKLGKESPELAPNHGYCAAQKSHYYGYKLHAVCNTQGVFQAFDITPASVHDIHYLNDVKHQFSDCILIGDKGYLSQTYQTDLFRERGIQLTTPSRKNQHVQAPFHPLLRRVRKRIETLYSQLCDQFMIRRNYAKTFQGFANRILTKITALTMIQWINKLDGNHINNLKIVVA